MNKFNNVSDLTLIKSQKLEESGKKLVAGFTQTMMKKPEQFSPGHFPVYLKGGEGAIVKDVDGNEYIDFICGLAANTLGHNHPAVTQAITGNLDKGLLHSLPAPIEINAAKAIVNMVPSAEMVRFFKTGADANSAAIRLARYITKKDEILTIGYNGWHDHYMFDTPGVPKVLQELTHRMSLITDDNEQPIFDLLQQRGGKIAAVVLSLPYNRIVSPEFIQALRLLCTEKNVIFIWDEIVTGFRLALGGAQEFYGISADLVTLSKGIAAGMPLSAVCGKHELMKQMEKLQVSTTFGGEMLSLEVCTSVLDEYRKSDYIERIAYLGKRLKDSVNRISQSLDTPLRIVGYDPIPMFLFSNNPKDHVEFAIPFLNEMARRGVLLRREVNFICGAHTDEHIDHTINAVNASLSAMQDRGIFSEKSREI